jgi:hypothetical protein
MWTALFNMFVEHERITAYEGLSLELVLVLAEQDGYQTRMIDLADSSVSLQRDHRNNRVNLLTESGLVKRAARF